ncbi:MAG: hypothetical protein WCG25_05420 [bacterium]
MEISSNNKQKLLHQTFCNCLNLFKIFFIVSSFASNSFSHKIGFNQYINCILFFSQTSIYDLNSSSFSLGYNTYGSFVTYISSLGQKRYEFIPLHSCHIYSNVFIL